VEVWQTSNLRPLRLGDEKRRKKNKEIKKPWGKNIMACPILQGGHNNARGGESSV